MGPPSLVSTVGKQLKEILVLVVCLLLKKETDLFQTIGIYFSMGTLRY